MDRMLEATEEQRKYAIDITVTLVVEELAGQLGVDSSQVLTDFIASNTGTLLYDESSKLWWNGPSYIAEMYKKEVSSSYQ